MPLAATLALLAACAPGPSVTMHDLYLYGAENARLSHFYGDAGEVSGADATLTLSQPEAGDAALEDRYAVRSALLVNGRPYLREPVEALERPAVQVERIPFTTDMLLKVNLDVDEVVYFDGSSFLLLTADGTPGNQVRVVPRPLFNRLRGLGELNAAEATMLEDAIREAGRPVALAFLPEGELPPHSVDGLEEQRRTAIFVQDDIGTNEEALRPAPQELTWEVMAQGNQAVGFDRATYELVTRQPQLLALWNRAYGNQLTVPAVPRLDFQRETVVALFAGQKATGGYGIEVAKVSEENGELYVDIRLVEPGEGAITTQALTSPWTMVRVLRGGYEVAWLRDADTGALIAAARAAL